MTPAPLLQKLFRKGAGRSSLVFALGGMGMGILVLLISLQAYLDLNQLLASTATAGLANFLVIHKEIPADRASHSAFTAAEASDLSRQPFVKSAGPITSNRFRAAATAGFHIQFYTDVFFQSVPDSFLDSRPQTWHWSPGDGVLPVILSADYLAMYNYGFALSQGLPQISETAAEAIPISITISGTQGSLQLIAHVVGFSDRISSILVPQDFMDWANAHYGNASAAASGMIIKITDPSDPSLAAYLKAHHYQTNNEQLKYSRIRVILATVLSVIGLFGLAVIALALILFSVYLQLVIAASREEIRLLTLLGYEPRTLGTALTRGMLPRYGLMALIALMVTELLQWAACRLLHHRNLPASPVISLYLLLCTLGILTVFYLITQKAVYKNISAVG
jgi:hypothetical protein